MSTSGPPDSVRLGPPDAPPPARPKTRWEIYGPRHPRRLLLIMLGAMVVICGGVFALAPRLGGNLTAGAGPCGWKLQQLGQAFVNDVVQRGAYPEEADATYLIGLVRNGSIPAGKEDLLVCGWDNEALLIKTDEDRALFHSADLSDPEAVIPLCSFAIRDFARYPVDLDDEEAWLLCERMGANGRTPHHTDGINVFFADGRSRFLRREDLDIAPEDPIVVGPDSPHPELAKMIFLRDR